MNKGNYLEQPPLGCMPRWLHDENRARELAVAILNCMQAGCSINPDWIEEYNEITQRARKEGYKLCLNLKIQ